MFPWIQFVRIESPGCKPLLRTWFCGCFCGRQVWRRRESQDWAGLHGLGKLSVLPELPCPLVTKEVLWNTEQKDPSASQPVPSGSASRSCACNLGLSDPSGLPLG
eukprot:XP_011249048.1 PREDICTED: uncharacterized protein Gm38947 [Mus musculus]